MRHASSNARIKASVAERGDLFLKALAAESDIAGLFETASASPARTPSAALVLR